MMSPYKFLKKPGGENFFKNEQAKLKRKAREASFDSTGVDPSHLNIESH